VPDPPSPPNMGCSNARILGMFGVDGRRAELAHGMLLSTRGKGFNAKGKTARDDSHIMHVTRRADTPGL